MGKGHPCLGCGIVLVCLDIASEDNSLSAHILTVSPGKQTGNLILFKIKFQVLEATVKSMGIFKLQVAAVLVINNNNNNDNTFPCLQKLSSVDFNVSWIWSGETDNIQFAIEGPCL